MVARGRCSSGRHCGQVGSTSAEALLDAEPDTPVALSRSTRGTHRPHAMHRMAPPILSALRHTVHVGATGCSSGLGPTSSSVGQRLTINSTICSYLASDQYDALLSRNPSRNDAVSPSAAPRLATPTHASRGKISHHRRSRHLEEESPCHAQPVCASPLD